MLSTGLPGRRKRGTLRRQDVGMVGLPAHQTARAVEDGELAVWILVLPHLGSDEVGAGGMGRDLQPFRFQATVLSGATVRSSWIASTSRHCASATGTKAEPGSAGAMAKRPLWAAR